MQPMWRIIVLNISRCKPVRDMANNSFKHYFLVCGGVNSSSCVYIPMNVTYWHIFNEFLYVLRSDHTGWGEINR